jgi:hypothetical protein
MKGDFWQNDKHMIEKNGYKPVIADAAQFL